MFEVESLKYATLATVSRCGMVWFSEEVVSLDMVYFHYLERLKQKEFNSLIREDAPGEEIKENAEVPGAVGYDDSSKQAKRTREVCVESIKKLFLKDGFVTQCIEYSQHQNHVMKFTPIRALEAMFALIRKGINYILEYNEERSEFPLDDNQIEAYMTKWVVSSAIWGIGGSLNLAGRHEFCDKIHELTSVDLPDPSGPPIIDYEVRIDDQQWHLWKERVPRIDVEIEKVTSADTVITTVDTIRHQEMLCSWLSQRVPFILCGPPGSGKTMTLISTLNALTDCQMIFVNFSSSTTPELILRSFDQYCEYKKTTKNEQLILRPKQTNKWLIVFCDEINLPETDKYGTQKVISFLRQLTEQNGFYRPLDKSWVTLERIQFVGACNPPTDQGRHPMTDRFMRHYPLILVDFPGEESLKQIYSTFNRAMMKRLPDLSGYAEPLTEAMVEFYEESQKHFTADQQPHYVYSPRELTRWKLAIYEALDGIECLEDLVRLYTHEALRLFEDRLVTQEEKDWCNETVNLIASKWFPGANLDHALNRPILFSQYLDRIYKSVEQEKLRKFIQGKLHTFNEEELDVPLVVFDSVVDHILRIDRVLKQPLGHLLLVGASGVGKTTLARFVAWINNQTVFQIKAGKNYSLDNFDEDIRSVMRRSGVKGEKICFIFDESNVLSSAFLERMNALLASGEVPGLFDGDDYTHLINQCKESAQKMIDSEEDLYKNFVREVQRNLHVVFTMNPANPDFSNRTASSPALFNRCVIDWFGEWDDESLWQVAKEFTKEIELIDESFEGFDGSIEEAIGEENINPKHEALISTIVSIHKSVKQVSVKCCFANSNFLTLSCLTSLCRPM
jgi:dynein heavy chain 1, cytosolic